ncbi:Na+/H+ antiporter [Amycolatopsis balhimycina DSM 5908]|uniref:Na+/H+ antiporter n=1 Tax=Amycolatopsis balhimycina DSM 5908 TaxID=1081091 RepID=A0A428WMD2_AMYBA|nr:Na+/H+ antiporter [Amycolatopsis balhimycina]RSM44202.1 Na+/H+ antiporter [Amycolatopsis balhimycina DSM 5908]
MLGLELVVLLGLAVLLGRAASARFGIAPPIALLAAGVLLGFVPALRAVHLPPELVLLLFLPALLYWESLTTSLREIRANLRGIVLLSTVLVIATAATVAVVAHALGLPWGPAWVLGAAVAPTDATAVGVIARLLPRSQVTVLRAESLVNDGTALVIYGLAVGVTVGEEQLGAAHVGWLFLLSYVGGAAAGAVTGWVAAQVRRRQTDPLTGQVTMLLIPFTAFLLAEAIHASGVLAVVVAGLIMSQAAPRGVVRADMRLQAQAFWTMATFLLNATLFVLVGLELQSAVRGLTGTALPRALGAVAAVTAVVLAARLVFLFTVPYLVRLLDRRPRQRARRVDHRPRLVSAFTGFRGAVSLAAALAVPHQLASGEPFPDRDMIVFVTGGVIVLTLLQGLVLPRIVRWARLPRDTAVEIEHQLAETRATEDALGALPGLAAGLGTDPDVVDRVGRELGERLELLRADGSADHPAVRHDEHYTALHRALIAHKRETVVRLRDERHIDDTVLRQVQAALDLEEVRLSPTEPAE